MLSARMCQAVRSAAIAATFLFVLAVVAFAQERRQNIPGQFDFYVLALSWSPSFCETAKKRGADSRSDPQCSGRPFAFIVHGLWPEYEKGFPSYCQVPAPRLDRSIVGTALGIIPSPRLIFREWDRHGTCSGLKPDAYFAAMQKARAAVKIPPAYLAPAEPLTVTPDEVAAEFVKANPGLSRASMAVICDATRLSGVRLCMTKGFTFHECADVASRACNREKIVMPAVQRE